MAESVTISAAPPANPGLDYRELVAEGIALSHQYAGEIWTDYNESDPGVTTLEQLCYALTELSYRAEFPLPDLLAEPGGRINARRQALYPARRIFPCNPLTERDYRKLFLDRIPSLGNIWLHPHRDTSKRSIEGLYDLTLYAPSLQPPPCAPAEEERALRDRVRRIYCRHRNLCEDLRSIEILRPERATVLAKVSIGDAPRPEAILAQLLFRAALLFAPEPRRQPLRSLVERGVQPSAIFEGPLLLNGFIDDGELQAKAASIRVQDVVRTLARTAGVVSLSDVCVRALGKKYESDESIEIPSWAILQVDTRSDVRHGHYSIRLFRNGLEIRPDPARVQRELDKLWSEQRRTYRLSAQYDEYFGFPAGTWRDLGSYSSVQDQFPDVYGINAYGVEAGATAARQAQARQFKGYLLVFDQLFANYFAQLAHAKELYSTDGGQRQTYFFQSLRTLVPNVEPLLKRNYDAGLARIVAGDDPYVERRNRFLDFLLALYAEKLDDSSVWTLQPDDEQSVKTGQRLLEAKLALLRRLVAITHNRGRAVDYLERPSRGNMAGMELKIRIQLGMDVLDVRPLAEVADELGVELVEQEPDTTLLRYAEVIEEQFAAVTPSGGVTPMHGLAVPEALLSAAVEELRVGRIPGDSAWSVVWKDSEWRPAGKYRDRESAVAAAGAFAAMLQTLHRHCQQLYIVEHTLLRSSRFREKGRDFPYDFTATAVLSPPAARTGGDYREFARGVIRENAPAHVVMNDLLLGPRQMQAFERLYWPWRRALRQQDRREIIRASAALRVFLERHQGSA